MDKRRIALREVPLEAAVETALQTAGMIVTMSRGQWDTLLKIAYEHGAVLVEVDDREHPVRAFQRAAN